MRTYNIKLHISPSICVVNENINLENASILFRITHAILSTNYTLYLLGPFWNGLLEKEVRIKWNVIQNGFMSACKGVNANVQRRWTRWKIEKKNWYPLFACVLYQNPILHTPFFGERCWHRHSSDYYRNLSGDYRIRTDRHTVYTKNPSAQGTQQTETPAQLGWSEIWKM